MGPVCREPPPHHHHDELVNRGRESEHPLPEHPSEEGSGRFDLLVGFSHQLHGLLLFPGVVHDELGVCRWRRDGRKTGRCSAEDGEEES